MKKLPVDLSKIYVFGVMYTTVHKFVQELVPKKAFFFFSMFKMAYHSPRLLLFDQNNSKNSNIVIFQSKITSIVTF